MVGGAIGQNVRVAVRVRPFNQREHERGAACCIQVVDGKKTTITDPESGRVREFVFDFSYWSHEPGDPHFADQEKVFDDLGVDCLQSAWEGYNCRCDRVGLLRLQFSPTACLLPVHSLFAYGQTGSGKSFSMVGNAQSAAADLLAGDQAGIVPRVCQSMFERISANNDPDLSFKVETSMLEIYNERVRDLFNPTNTPPGGLTVREHPKTGPYVHGLSSLLVDSYSSIDRLMQEGTKARTIASTKMNETSSRAHTIFQIILTQTRVDRAAGQATDRVSRINLVDLAGSERANSTGATGDRLKEGININKSLSALGNCINALAEQAKHRGDSSKPHVPYRNSVLTWLLKDSLGGNARTVMVAALSPADINFEETLSTLRYANRAKQIQNVAIVNEDQNQKMVRQLREEVAALRAQLESKQVVPDAEQRRQQLEEELQESQRLIAQLQMTWAEKERQTVAIGADRAQALQAMGLTTDASLLGKPHLVNLNEDASLSGCLVYILCPGETLVGRSGIGDVPETGASAIRLQGLGIASDHCTLANKSGVVTIHANGGDAAHTFVNGKRVEASMVLRHGDRIIFGSANFFKFSDPSEAAKTRGDSSERKVSGTAAIDWEFAMNERLQEAMASSLEDSQLAKQALAQAQRDFAEQEARLAAEKAETEAKLEQQQELFQKQIAEQTGATGAAAAQLQAMRQQLVEQQQAFEEELRAKEAKLNTKRQELHRSELADRQQSLLEDELARVIPIVEEANLLGAELRRQTVFEVKVVSDYAMQHNRRAADSRDTVLGEPRSTAKVKVTYLTQERSCLWEHDKLLNRIYLMRELYARVQEEPTCLSAVTKETSANERENDPFYDPPESQLVGVAHIYLESLAYLLDIQQKTIIVDYQGNTAGTLEIDLLPCSVEGIVGSESVACIDEPSEMLNTRFDLLVRVKRATDIGKQHSLHGSFVCHKFYLDSEVNCTPVATPEAMQAQSYCYEHSRHLTIEPVTSQFVQYLQEGSMTFEVWSQPHDEMSLPAVTLAQNSPEAPTVNLKSPINGQIDGDTTDDAQNTLSGDTQNLAARIEHIEAEMRASQSRVLELEAALEKERQETDRARIALAKTEEALTKSRKSSGMCVIA